MSEPELSPIAYGEFVSDVHAIADALQADHWRPDYIVGIGRGGLVPCGIPLAPFRHIDALDRFQLGRSRLRR
jgi:hypothetical protein